MKAEDAIRDALQEIGIQAAEQPILSDPMQTGIRYLNRMMRGVAYLGLGYTVITSSSQEVTVPSYAEEWVVFALAKRLSVQFPPMDDSDKFTLGQNLTEAWNNLLLQRDTDEEMSYPSTLPTGSGNDGLHSSKFYANEDDYLLDESGDYILLEN